MARRRNALGIVMTIMILVACGSTRSKPAPDRPFTGAPVAVVVDKLGDDSAEVSVYNFADVPIVAYWFLVRYRDADGKVLGAIDQMSVSGMRYRADPTSWTSFEIETLDVPAGAATAEMIVKDVSTTKDGMTIERASLWSMPGMDWPERP